MLQEINGLTKSETIKNYTEKDNTIEVTYQDGSKDIFEKTPKNLKKIIDHMEKQAVNFLLENDKLNNEEMFKTDSKNKKNKFLIYVSSLGIAVIVGGLFLNPITVSIIALLSFLTAKGFVNYNNVEAKYDDIKKYGLYLKNKRSLEEEYSQIVKKERTIDKHIIKTTPNKEVNINSIDNFSADDIKYILEKIKRYHDVDEEVQIPEQITKRKSLVIKNK